VATMHSGESARFVIAPAYGYGDASGDSEVPPGSTLLFEVELLDVRAEGSVKTVSKDTDLNRLAEIRKEREAAEVKRVAEREAAEARKIASDAQRAEKSRKGGGASGGKEAAKEAAKEALKKKAAEREEKAAAAAVEKEAKRAKAAQLKAGAESRKAAAGDAAAAAPKRPPGYVSDED
jgi:hypothetical protein